MSTRIVSLPLRFAASLLVATLACLLLAPDACAQTAAVAANWTQQSPPSSPSARYSPAMAYDAATGQVVLFGGGGNGGNETWTWGGTTWTQQTPATSPPGRHDATMVFDTATGQLVLFGGYGSSLLADTWTWNGTTWTQQTPATSPPGRLRAASAYDAATGQVVLFGGEGLGAQGSDSYLGDTWTWNGNTWARQTPAASPSARSSPTVAYDATTSQVVLFGGLSNAAFESDTWTWNGTTWTLQTPATSPPGRYRAESAYDAATGQVLLFSGESTVYLADTWAWDGTTWTQQALATNPPGRSLAGMAYDAAIGQVVLFGGLEVATKEGDTWTYQRGAAATPISAVSTAAAQVPVYFQIGTAGTLPALSNSNVLTQGAPNVDFTLGTGSTCTGAVTAASTCTINVVFTPQYPGQRLGAVNLLNSAGRALATASINGTGTGSLVSFAPGVISTVAGTGVQCTTSAISGCADGGAATSAQLDFPTGGAVDAAGNLFIMDDFANRVRKVSVGTGAISTVAGNGTQCSSATAACGDGGAATSAQLGTPYDLAVDGAGNLFIADSHDNRIRKVTASTGLISTIAGSGSACFTPGSAAACGDGGAAISAQFNNVLGVAVDGLGDLFLSDTGDFRVREVTAATGAVSTVAGNGVQCSSATDACGDGGAATAAQLMAPARTAVDAAGNLYIADSAANRVRKVTAATGLISTVAGTGFACSSAFSACGDGGPATSAQLGSPRGIAVDAAGDLYIADANDNRVREVTASGIIFTVAGSGTPCSSSSTTGCSDGGAATAGQLNGGVATFLDGAGNLYIIDESSHRIRRVTASAAPLLFPTTAVGSRSAAQTVLVHNIGNAALTLPIPATGQNPSLSSYFVQPSSFSTDVCPVEYSSSFSAATLAPGVICTESLSYAPTVSGAVTGNLIFTDNSLNASAATQTFIMVGSTATSTLTVAAVAQNTPAGTASITLSFTIGWGTGPAPAGAPTLTVKGSSSGVGTVTCINKAGHNNCSATYNTSTLAPGTYTITATQPADSNYPASSGNAVLTITGSPGGHIAAPVKTLGPTAIFTPANALSKR